MIVILFITCAFIVSICYIIHWLRLHRWQKLALDARFWLSDTIFQERFQVIYNRDLFYRQLGTPHYINNETSRFVAVKRDVNGACWYLCNFNTDHAHKRQGAAKSLTRCTIPHLWLHCRRIFALTMTDQKPTYFTFLNQFFYKVTPIFFILSTTLDSLPRYSLNKWITTQQTGKHLRFGNKPLVHRIADHNKTWDDSATVPFPKDAVIMTSLFEWEMTSDIVPWAKGYIYHTYFTTTDLLQLDSSVL